VVDSTVLGIAVAFVGVEVAYVLLKPNDTTPDDNPLQDGVISNLLVFLVVLPSLVMVYGLTCDGGKSFTSRALQLPAAKWLGSVSYSLYLSQNIVRYYVFFVQGTGGYSPTGWDGVGYSPWFILPMAAACLPLAWLLYTFVEEPSRRYLCGLGDGPQAPLDSGSAWGTFGNLVGGNTERLSEKASDDGRAKLLESNQASSL
jgi:peptidoglycan/LPS O-acetylase OafA/YrhL